MNILKVIPKYFYLNCFKQRLSFNSVWIMFWVTVTEHVQHLGGSRIYRCLFHSTLEFVAMSHVCINIFKCPVSAAHTALTSSLVWWSFLFEQFHSFGDIFHSFSQKVNPLNFEICLETKEAQKMDEPRKKQRKNIIDVHFL